MILLQNYLPPFLKGGRGGFCLIVAPSWHIEIPPSPPLGKGGSGRISRFVTVSYIPRLLQKRPGQQILEHCLALRDDGLLVLMPVP